MTPEFLRSRREALVALAEKRGLDWASSVEGFEKDDALVIAAISTLLGLEVARAFADIPLEEVERYSTEARAEQENREDVLQNVRLAQMASDAEGNQ